ncbi:hypothetical protein [Microbacterium sp. KR10-403]|uniref:aggregation-promoting factor C-terminal-like domain-containing protein n=1 Tax=Microbacterium sp. KR10-403 TaxID=3158581 RepID=UPI0032E3DCA3
MAIAGWRRLRIPRGIVGATLAAAVLLAPSALGVSRAAAETPPPTAPGYPTWAEVQAARASTEATAAEVDRVDDALTGALDAAAVASQKAVTAQAAAQKARAASEAAGQRADTLSAQAAAAATRSGRSTAATAELARTLTAAEGQQGFTAQLLASDDPDELLARLNALSNLTDWWHDAADAAQADKELAASLRDRARAAEAERNRLADEAERSADAAETAADEANAVAAKLQKSIDTLYAQLAVLQDSTAETERQYDIGVRVAAQASDQQRRREKAASDEPATAAAASVGTAEPLGGALSPAQARAYARRAMLSYGWGDTQYSCLVKLWNMESGWRWNALNPYSGAYGIPQALPAKKLAAAGADWRTNAATQIRWGLAYISDRYDTPCGAWRHEMSHDPHWY